MNPLKQVKDSGDRPTVIYNDNSATKSQFERTRVICLFAWCIITIILMIVNYIIVSIDNRICTFLLLQDHNPACICSMFAIEILLISPLLFIYTMLCACRYSCNGYTKI
jgi:hypothetical protein